GGAPLLRDAPASQGHLPGGLVITTLAESIRLTNTARATRQELRAWTDALLESGPPTDVVTALQGLAELIDARGLHLDGLRTALATPRADTHHARHAIDALRERVARRHRVDASFRSERDLARKGISLVEDACTLLLDGALEEAMLPVPDERERFV